MRVMSCQHRHSVSPASLSLLAVRVEPERFRFNGVYRLIYYYCGCSSDYGGVVAMEVIRVEPLMVVVVDC
eukprot:jgi/Chrzof1/9560/Cz04g07260.t1